MTPALVRAAAHRTDLPFPHQYPPITDPISQLESGIRKVVYHYTSFSAIQDPTCQSKHPQSDHHPSESYVLTAYPLTRMLAQALSNIITNNDPCADKLWSTYLSLPEEQNILLYVLRDSVWILFFFLTS